MSTESPNHFDYLLQVSNKHLWILILYTFLMFFHFLLGQGQTTLCGQNPDVNRKALLLCQFVASWTNNDEPKAPMLHTKAQGQWPFGSDIWRVFTIYGRGGHLGHLTQMLRPNCRSPDPWRLHMKFGFDWPSGFGEEDLWKWWTDGQTTDVRRSISLKAQVS